MIDWDRIAELQTEVGEDGIEEVIELFIEEVEEAIGSLGDITDAKVLGEKLHFLKGSAQNLGLSALSDICAREEAAIRHDPAHTVTVPEISEAMKTAVSELKSIAA